MQIIKDVSAANLCNSYVQTIGFFDGVHAGHRFLLDQVKREADRRAMLSMAITFYEHPATVLRPSNSPYLLTSLSEKLNLIEKCGIDAVAVLNFDELMASMSAAVFMKEILIAHLGGKALVIGYDHHFGRPSGEVFADYMQQGREAGLDVVRAKELLPKYCWRESINSGVSCCTAAGFLAADDAMRGGAGEHNDVGDAVSSSKVKGEIADDGVLSATARQMLAGDAVWSSIMERTVGGGAVSSSAIRGMIADGDVQGAACLLGRNYSLCGEVVHGEAIGRGLGFPTANIVVEDNRKLLPKDGAYAVRVRVVNECYCGMLYIGRRPTFDGLDQKRVEVHLLDFNDELYGQSIAVEFIARLRDERHFDTPQSLSEQLKKDLELTRALVAASCSDID